MVPTGKVRSIRMRDNIIKSSTLTPLLRSWLVKAFLPGIGLAIYFLFRPEPFFLYFEHMDKLGHFAVFCILYLLSYMTFGTRLNAGVLVVLLLGLAIGSELLQGSVYLPHRHYSTEDIMANISGLIVGWLVFGKGVR